MIDHDYKVNFMIDNLPALTRQENNINYFTDEYFTNDVDIGFNIGEDYFSREELKLKFFINNHINIKINYTET